MMANFTTKEIKLLILFLHDYIEELSYNGCNDFRFPDNWSITEIKKFCKHIPANKEKGVPKYVYPDVLVVDVFVARLTSYMEENLMNNLNKKEIELLIMFLKDYVQELSCNGCNDFEFPEDWTEQDIKTFNEQNSVHSYEDDDGTIVYAQEDFCVVGGLINKLKRLRDNE